MRLVDPVAYDARIGAMNVCLTEMWVATLRESNGFFKPIDYIIAKTKFHNASSNIELDEMDKVCKFVIDGQQLVMKATLCKRLNEMFETSTNQFQLAVTAYIRRIINTRVPCISVDFWKVIACQSM